MPATCACEERALQTVPWEAQQQACHEQRKKRPCWAYKNWHNTVLLSRTPEQKTIYVQGHTNKTQGTPPNTPVAIAIPIIYATMRNSRVWALSCIRRYRRRSKGSNSPEIRMRNLFIMVAVGHLIQLGDIRVKKKTCGSVRVYSSFALTLC